MKGNREGESDKEREGPKGFEGQPEGSEGQPEGSEIQLEGSEGTLGGWTDGCTDGRNFSPFCSLPEPLPKKKERRKKE